LFSLKTVAAEESAEEYLNKIRTSKNLQAEEIVNYRLKALALEPSIQKYFFDVSVFDYAPCEENEEFFLDVYDVSYWPHYFEKADNYPSTLSVIEEAAQLHPDNPDIQANLAYLYLMKKEAGLKDAFSALSKALHTDPSHRNSLHYLADICQKFPPQDIEDLLRDVCKRKPENPYAYQALGVFYYKQKKIEESMQAYKKALEQDPQSIKIMHILGHFYLYMLKEAKVSNDDIVLFKTKANILFSDALALAEERENKILRKYYDVSGGNKNNVLHFEQSIREVIINAHSDEEAIDAIVSVLTIRLDRAKFWSDLGDLAKAEEEVQAAESLFSEGFYSQIQGKPIYHSSGHFLLHVPSDIRYLIAQRYDELADKAGAIRVAGAMAYDSIMKNKIEGLENKALDLINTHDLKSARSYIRQAIALGSSNKEMFHSLADISYNKEYNLMDYTESALARKRYINMAGGEHAEAVEWASLSKSYAIIADYKSAAEAAWQGYKNHSWVNDLFECMVIYTYGAYGQQEALRIWKEVKYRDFEINGQAAEEKKLLDMIQRGISELGRKAEESNNLYSALKHYSLVFSTFVGPRNDAKSETMDKIVEIYRKLPLKLKPSPEAVKYAVEAEKCIRRRNLNCAQNGYYNAIREAPWWPQAHYNLALVWGSVESESVYEMGVFLKLDPDSTNEKIAQQKISDWKKIFQ
jgi:tetratricopeptide (TPR) repeat protein